MSRPEPASATFRFGTESLTLPQEIFILLRDLIVRRTGVYFDDGKRGFLADKLSEGVSSLGLTSFLDYYYLLRYDTDAGQHWSRLMDWLAVPETYFWRQSEQFDALAQIIAPAHFAARPGQPLRIWSAACCTGEEPISIAMALAEAGFGTHPVEIVASDGSSAMLQRARRGRYGERSFRQLPEAMRDRYFRDCGDGTWNPIPELTRNIRWSLANLANAAEVGPLATADVIFCRNVFIYFSNQSISRTVGTFAAHIRPPGHLFVAASESLLRITEDFELQEIGNAFVYVRRPRAV